MGAGLWLYDLFARTPRAERHRRVNRARALAAEPMLNPAALAGGAFYYDAGGDDARLTIENVLDAAYHGAAIANYVELERFAHAEGRIAAAEVRDRLGGTRFELRARLFVNAAGPWIDDVRRLDDPAAAPSVRLTKGVHLVIDRERLPVREALVLGDAHGRIVFVIPHGEVVLVGTTDTDFDGDRERVAAEPEDIEYLLGVVEQSLPGATLTPADVAASFAGLRALAAAGDGRAPSSVSREEVIVESGSGLISIAGGKLTTHREIAERIVESRGNDSGRGAGRRADARYAAARARVRWKSRIPAAPQRRSPRCPRICARRWPRAMELARSCRRVSSANRPSWRGRSLPDARSRPPR